jgi:hypothetical protein
MELTVANLLIRLSLWDLSSLVHGGEFGKPVHLLDVSFLSGWCSKTVYRRLAGLQGETCPIQKPALFVIRRNR